MSVAHKASLPSREMARAAGDLKLPRLVKWWLVALTVLLAGAWLTCGLHLLPADTAPSAQGSVTSVAVADNPLPVLRGPVSRVSGEVIDGPWGRLEVVPITISPPAESLEQRRQDNSQRVEWHFPDTSRARLGDVFIEIGLPDSLIARLKSLARSNDSVHGYTILPGRELVLGLSPEVRAKLYVFLHGFMQNKDQRNGFQFCGDSVEQWFGDAPLSPETKQLVTPLIYRHGGFLFFSDLRSIKPLLPSDEERASLIRALSRESTFLLRLRVSQASDVEALVAYWGRGGREKEVRPILESLAKFPHEQSLDVTHLLPPFARGRTYTYPPRSGRISRSIARDCHWTALNFFSQQPDDRYGHVKEAFANFGKDYYRIYGSPQLGDLVVYVHESKGTVHSAVYVAADIVFTKNGASMFRPWMFLKLEDMDDYYPQPKKIPRGFFRRKGV